MGGTTAPVCGSRWLPTWMARVRKCIGIGQLSLDRCSLSVVIMSGAEVERVRNMPFQENRCAHAQAIGARKIGIWFSGWAIFGHIGLCPAIVLEVERCAMRTKGGFGCQRGGSETACTFVRNSWGPTWRGEIQEFCPRLDSN